VALKAALFVCLVTLVTPLAGCTDEQLHFGDDPRLLWWTDHETGDLADWLGKSEQGSFVLMAGSRVEVVVGIARSGTHALRVTDDSPTQRDYPLVARNGPLPIGVYTSAWYYVPRALHPISYWWYVLYRSRHPPYDSQSEGSGPTRPIRTSGGGRRHGGVYRESGVVVRQRFESEGRRRHDGLGKSPF
jgi:hypothetical protein